MQMAEVGHVSHRNRQHAGEVVVEVENTVVSEVGELRRERAVEDVVGEVEEAERAEISGGMGPERLFSARVRLERYYFSLVDVQIITGLRVDGKPVLGRLGARNIMCQNAFGLTPPDNAFEKAKIKFTWLFQEFAGLQVAEVSVHYLSLIDDMQAIGDYAWGAAAWATMHGCLQRRMINGLSYALMIFAIEHIRQLREELIGQVELPMELPLMLSWPPILCKVLNGNTTLKKGRYIAILDNLVEAECIRHPYERLGLAEYGGQLAKACSETLCINFLEIYPHTPNNHHTQFGFASIDPASARGLPAVVVPIKRKGPTPNVDLVADERFTAYKDAWLGRRPLRGQLQDDWALPLWMVDDIEELNQHTPPCTTSNATLDDLNPALNGYGTDGSDDPDHVYETDGLDPGHVYVISEGQQEPRLDVANADPAPIKVYQRKRRMEQVLEQNSEGQQEPRLDGANAEPAPIKVYQRRRRMEQVLEQNSEGQQEPRLDGANADPAPGPTGLHMHLRSVINRKGLNRNRDSLVYNEKLLQESECKVVMVLVLCLVLIISSTESRQLGTGNGKPSCDAVYAVQPADSCTSVIETFALDSDFFFSINPNINCSAIFVDQWLCVDGSA
ncbi:hypothetical protein ACLB2K_053245 [Fragaria x ananassa]